MPPQVPLVVDEAVVWRGRPDTRISLRWQDYTGLWIGGLSLIAGVYWLYSVPFSAGSLWWIGVFFVVMAPALILKAIMRSKIMRARTFYTLTDRRAIVSRRASGRGVVHDSYPIDDGMKIALKPGAPASVWFGERHLYRSRGRDVTEKVGFERIAEAPAVYEQMRDIQGRNGGP